MAMEMTGTRIRHELGRFFGTAVTVRAEAMALTTSRFTVLVSIVTIESARTVSKRLSLFEIAMSLGVEFQR